MVLFDLLLSEQILVRRRQGSVQRISEGQAERPAENPVVQIWVFFAEQENFPEKARRQVQAFRHLANFPATPIFAQQHFLDRGQYPQPLRGAHLEREQGPDQPPERQLANFLFLLHCLLPDLCSNTEASGICCCYLKGMFEYILEKIEFQNQDRYIWTAIAIGAFSIGFMVSTLVAPKK